MKTWKMMVVVAAFVSGGAGADCGPVRRSPGVARTDAARLLRAPAICDGGLDDGYICVDNRGGMVTCPSVMGDPCKVVAGKPEAP